ncbi:heavy-metal-associated domain-containing protein [Niveibacterium sp.]|uniref:heavy-metal-associated domain-containing protein n=1 Tax=Niveibacterium sp. TaxID=2017444 RepID=UPI0035B05184
MDTAKFSVGGMSCQGCVRSVERVLLAQQGVAEAQVSLELKEACVRFDPQSVALDTLKAAIRDAGFDAD